MKCYKAVNSEEEEGLYPPCRWFSQLGGGGSPPTIRQFAHPPLPRKIPPTNFYSRPHPPSPPKQQFSSYNSIKTTFTVVAIVPAPFLF